MLALLLTTLLPLNYLEPHTPVVTARILQPPPTPPPQTPPPSPLPLTTSSTQTALCWLCLLTGQKAGLVWKKVHRGGDKGKGGAGCERTAWAVGPLAMCSRSGNSLQRGVDVITATHRRDAAWSACSLGYSLVKSEWWKSITNLLPPPPPHTHTHTLVISIHPQMETQLLNQTHTC